MLNSEGKFEFPLTEERQRSIGALITYEAEFTNRIWSRTREITDEIEFWKNESHPVILGKDVVDQIDKLLHELHYLETVQERIMEEMDETLERYKIDDPELF